MADDQTPKISTVWRVEAAKDQVCPSAARRLQCLSGSTADELRAWQCMALPFRDCTSMRASSWMDCLMDKEGEGEGEKNRIRRNPSNHGPKLISRCSVLLDVCDVFLTANGTISRHAKSFLFIRGREKYTQSSHHSSERLKHTIVLYPCGEGRKRRTSWRRKHSQEEKNTQCTMVGCHVSWSSTCSSRPCRIRSSHSLRRRKCVV